MITLLKKTISHQSRKRIKNLLSRYFGHNVIKGKKHNFFKHSGAYMTNCRIIFHGSGNQIVMGGGGNRLINCTIEIFGNNNSIYIGDENLFNHITFWIEDENCKIQIGSLNKFTGQLQLSAVEGTSLTIGDNCLFSSGINITTTDSHSILNESGNRINPSRDIQIGDHVWVGTRVLILKGVSIAADTVVGAASLVCRSSIENCVAIAGNPARIVKRNINWNEKRI